MSSLTSVTGAIPPHKLDWPKTRIFLVFVAFVGLQFLLTMYLRMNVSPTADPEPEKIEEYNPELFKVMSFGQVPAVIDWMWIKTLEDPLLTHVKKGTHPAIYYTLDLVTNLDPAFMAAYTEGATLVSVIRDDGPGALSLLLRGEDFRTKVLPTLGDEFRSRYWDPEWRLPMLLAYVYLFDVDDMPSAAQAFETAARIPGSPPYLSILSRKLEKPGGQYEVGLHLLSFMIRSATDASVKEKLVQRFHYLQINAFLFSLDEQVDIYLTAHHLPKDRLANSEFRERIWRKFSQAARLPSQDPWGGILSLGEDGKITTTTPHRKVFGLD